MRTRSLSMLLVIAGCGSAAGPGYDPPIFTVNGVISSSSVATPPQIHVSLMWERVQLTTDTMSALGATVGYVAQDVVIAAQFPAQFQLSTSQAPPSEVFSGPNGVTYPYAFGLIVAWVDGNGNGVLDPVPSNGTTSPDTILGVSSTEVFFSRLSMPIIEPTYSIEPGFNLLTNSGTQYPLGCDTYESCNAGAESDAHNLPADGSLELALTGPNDFADELLCGVVIPPTNPAQLDNPPTMDDCAVPQAPAGGSVHFGCYPGTRIFAANMCDTDEGMCWSRCPVTYHGCPPSMPLPADWPCPSS